MTDTTYSGYTGAAATGTNSPFNVGTAYFSIVYQWRLIGNINIHAFPAIQHRPHRELRRIGLIQVATHFFSSSSASASLGTLIEEAALTGLALLNSMSSTQGHTFF